MNIGLAIKKIRKEKNLSQGELAKESGISQTSMYQIENGTRRPNPSNLKKICKVLGIPESILYLNGLEESDVPENKKESYKLLYPSIEEMIRKLVTDD